MSVTERHQIQTGDDDDWDDDDLLHIFSKKKVRIETTPLVTHLRVNNAVHPGAAEQ